MDKKELENKDRFTLELDKGNTRNDYESLVQKLKSIKNIINLLEKKLLKQEM